MTTLVLLIRPSLTMKKNYRETFERNSFEFSIWTCHIFCASSSLLYLVPAVKITSITKFYQRHIHPTSYTAWTPCHGFLHLHFSCNG